MSNNQDAKMDSYLDYELLERLEIARYSSLVDAGLNEQAAQLFALLESSKRREFANRHGADAALLASLNWKATEGGHWSCSLELEDLPEGVNSGLLDYFL